MEEDVCAEKQREEEFHDAMLHGELLNFKPQPIFHQRESISVCRGARRSL
jgi:hypothetical protein